MTVDGADAGGATVVIAEDESIIRLDLRETLIDEGYRVIGETGRGDEAVQLVRDLRPDLVILDIKMPGMSGLDAAALITGERLAAVLILTAFSQRELIVQARDAGALAYLIKPFQRSDLVPAIEVALGRFAELRALQEQSASLEDRLASRKVLDRAKGVLMDQHGYREHRAFRFIQTTAMTERTTMKAVADRIIDGSLHPEPDSPEPDSPDAPTLSPEVASTPAVVGESRLPEGGLS